MFSTLPIKVVSLAHNHVFDNLLNGYKKTIEKLNSKKIASLGSGENKKDASKPLVIMINDLKFCFFNYVTEDTNPNIPKDSPLEVNQFLIKRIPRGSASG